MIYAKRMWLCCIVFAALTVLFLRTSVAEAASLQSRAVGNVVGGLSSVYEEKNISLNGAMAPPTGTSQGFVARGNESGLASPNTALPNEQLVGVARISSKDVWAVGVSLVNSTSPLHTLAEHWNGTVWRAITSPNVGPSDNVLYAVAAISTNDVWAVGYYHQSSTSPFQTLTEHWNGSSWSIVANPNASTSDNYLISVAAVATNDVWVVGEYHQSSTSPYLTLTEHWNGSSWSIVSSPNAGKFYNGLFRVATISTSDVWAVGAYQASNSNSPHQTLTEHWNGSSWSIVSSPNVGAAYNFFVGAAAVSTSDVWAVGYSLASSTSPYLTLAEHWNGKSWSVVTSPNTGAFSNFLEGVAVISSKDVWSTGGYYTSGGSNPIEQTLAEHWNGTSWSVVATPNFGGKSTVNALFGIAAILTNDVWSVGYNQTSSTNFQAFTEHWDGKSWSIIPPG